MFAAKCSFSLLLLGALLTPPHGAWARGLLGRTSGVQRPATSCSRAPESTDHPFGVASGRGLTPVTEELIDAACFVSAPTAEGPPDTEPTSDAASDGAQAVLSENELAPTTQAPDPFDDDEYRLKKSRRKHAAEKNVTAIRTPLKFEPVTDLLTVVRVQLVPRLPRLREAAAALPHFGSGPCHSIPRPRESTIDLPFQSAALLA